MVKTDKASKTAANPKTQSATNAIEAEKEAGIASSKQAKQRNGRLPLAKNKLDEIGIDVLCASIVDGVSLTEFAEKSGVSKGTLLTWVAIDIDRSARVREARTHSARLWDEKAERGIEQAVDKFGLEKANSLAHHYRWRASKIAVREYGDKIEVGNDPENPMPGATVIFVPVKS